MNSLLDKLRSLFTSPRGDNARPAPTASAGAAKTAPASNAAKPAGKHGDGHCCGHCH